MKSAVAPFEKNDIAETILSAAVNRFSEYGYNKTTMAEIAEDAGMSAANIYRYYKSKEEIAAACAKNNMCGKISVLKDIVRDNKLTATEKLEQFVLVTLQLSQEAATENKKIEEVCSEITKSRHDLIHDKIRDTQALLVEILSYGNQTGEFDVDDVIDTATAINAMLVVFDVPMFMQLFSREEFEDKAKSVIKFLNAGLMKQ